ncbi:Uu.00g094040.m01.CDS01 [Anthostomella pinea]|uniref:Uu.00g094040.m01.CDS01 n=1 Tax=Anthostomella pinea TaxID=933095 RepID=A0AAI8VNN4_9PEZI|nr:Uu.00g094040.m01.CDS01 [Anthostomella pinea]
MAGSNTVAPLVHDHCRYESPNCYHAGHPPYADCAAKIHHVVRQHGEHGPYLVTSPNIPNADFSITVATSANFVNKHVGTRPLQPELKSKRKIPKKAKAVLAPLRKLPKLTSCSISFNRKSKHNLGGLARDAALQVISNRPALPFHRYNDLPSELRLRILSYTDLVLPVKEVFWSDSSGYAITTIKNPTEQAPLAVEDLFSTGPPPLAGQRSACKFVAYGNAPTALFLVSKAFAEEAHVVFFGQNNIIVPLNDSVGDLTVHFGSPHPPEWYLDKINDATEEEDSSNTLEYFQTQGLNLKLLQLDVSRKSRPRMISSEMWANGATVTNLDSQADTINIPGLRLWEDLFTAKAIVSLRAFVAQKSWPFDSDGAPFGVRQLNVNLKRVTFEFHPGVTSNLTVFYHLRRRSELMSAETHKESHKLGMTRISPDVVLPRNDDLEGAPDKKGEWIEEAWVSFPGW